MSPGAVTYKADYFGPIPVQLRTIQSSKDPDVATQQTIQEMGRMICAATSSPIMTRIASELERGPADEMATARRVFDWCASHIEFFPDDPVLVKVLGFQQALELLIDPPLLVSMPHPAGDCDDFTMLAATLLRILGVPVELVTIAADRKDPNLFTHVYLQLVLASGERLVCDFSHGPYPGWEAARHYRRQVWNLAGKPITAPAPIQFPEETTMKGFSGYVGLGDLTDTIDTVSEELGTFDPFASSDFLGQLENNLPINDPTVFAPIEAAAGSLPSSVSSIFSTIANDATSLTNTILGMPRSGEYVVTGPNGQQIRSYNVPGASPTGISLGTGSLSGSTLLLAVGAIAFLFMFSKSK
jgi:hypothetical protein